jgi:uncharacterized phage protein (TIGR01671 family)
MREIKFRAWDKREKQWDNQFSIHADGYAYITYITGGFYEEALELTPARYELMQYTGLKDKNGKGVYEGDIICYKEFPAVISYDIEVVKWEKWITGFSPFNVYDSDCGHYFPFDDFEVIGNIYENPELLGKK